jgi:hypothetical protein
MEADEQKKENKTFTFLPGYKLDAGHVLPAAWLRCVVQDTIKCHRELLGYRYDLLLYFRFILAFLLLIVQDFKI